MKQISFDKGFELHHREYGQLSKDTKVVMNGDHYVGMAIECDLITTLKVYFRGGFYLNRKAKTEENIKELFEETLKGITEVIGY